MQRVAASTHLKLAFMPGVRGQREIQINRCANCTTTHAHDALDAALATMELKRQLTR